MSAKFRVMIDASHYLDQLHAFAQSFPEETQEALFEIACDLAGESGERAPVLTGDLRNNCTARVDGVVVYTELSKTGARPGPPRQRIIATVGYSLPYAVRQHEEVNYNHPLGGEAKYLENPLHENLDSFRARLREVPARAKARGK